MSIQINNVDIIDDGKNIVNAVNSNITGISTSATGCVTGTFTGATLCGGTVCATTGFSGDGASLTNLTAANIPGLPALIPAGASVCEITSSTTWTKPSASVFLVQVWSAGGGGGGGAGNFGGTPFIVYGTQGGSGGGFFEKIYKSPELSPTVSVVVGSGGNGGTGWTAGSNTATTAGCSGGNSCFGPLTVIGGTGGSNNCDNINGRGGSIVPPLGCNYLYGGWYGSGGGEDGLVSVYGGGGGGFEKACFPGAVPQPCYGGVASVLGGSGGGAGGRIIPPAIPGASTYSPGSNGGAPLLVCSCIRGGGCSGTSTAFGVGGGGGASAGTGVAGCPGGLTAGGGGGGNGNTGPGANGGNGGNGYVRIISW